ncbi:MAG: hypothetical protein R3A10_17585 [Caldilineaceae bacterium]
MVSRLIDQGLLIESGVRHRHGCWRATARRHAAHGRHALCRAHGRVHRGALLQPRLTGAVPRVWTSCSRRPQRKVTALAADFYSSFWGIDGHRGEVSFEHGKPTISAGWSGNPRGCNWRKGPTSW